MVAAEDVAADAGVAYVVGDCVAYQEVVDAPAGVVLAGIKAIAPPAVDALDVGVCRTPGIGKAGVEQLGKLAALLVRKAGVAAVGLGVLKVDLLVRHVKVAAGHDGFAGLALERVQKAAVSIVPGHAHVDAGEFILGVGCIDVDKPELVELQRADTALGRGLGNELSCLTLAGVGQQRIGVQHAQRFLAAKDRSARIAFTLGVAPGLVIAGQVNIDLAFLQLGLLQRQDIDVEFLRDLDKARVLFEHGAQAVNVPRGESVSLRHGVLSTGLAGLRLTQQGRGGLRGRRRNRSRPDQHGRRTNMTQAITDPKQASAALAELFNTHKRMVFFGGAGVSTASGIPDFRSVDGLYHQQFAYPPETMLSHSFYETHPAEFFDFYRTKMIALNAKPNRCHTKLAELERAGKLDVVVTQNIDGLHQMAGSQRVFELHGSVHRNICQSCGAVYSAEWICSREHEDAAGVPVCPACGGRIKPDVVLYEEPLDEHVLTGAVAAIAAADALIVGGTSLVVYPAAGLTRYFTGDTLAICNLAPTDQDANADLLISCDIAAAFAF